MAQQTMHNNTKSKNPDDVFSSATDSFRMAMDAGMKFQKDAFDTVSKMFCCGTDCGDMKAKVEDTAAETINMVRKNAEQAQKAFDENCRTGLAAFRKTFDSMRDDNKDMFTRAGDIWNCCFETMRGNIEMTARTATQSIENWTEFMGKTMKNDSAKPTK